MAMRPLKLALRLCSAGVVSWTLMVGCQESVPTAPSDPAVGIHIYSDANFQGFSKQLISDSANLVDVKDGSKECRYVTEDVSRNYHSWDDCISSVLVLPGWSATLYEHPDFRGRSLELLADALNLQLISGRCSRDDDWNDCTSSIRVRRR
jgi:hypothetical protein